MKTLLASLALVLLVSSTAPAQTKGKPSAKAPAPPPAKVALGQVRDRRSDGSFFKKLEINLVLPEVPAADVAAARTVVSAAVDDTGRNLVPEDAGSTTLQPLSNSFGSEPGKPEPAQVVLELKNPARKAGAVASVAGEIELFMPGRDAGAVATIPKIAAQAGKTIADPALKANGVTIAVLGKEQLDAEKKRQVEAFRQAARKDGFAGDELAERVAEFTSNFFKPEEGALVLKVKAPEGRIHEMVYVDAAGEEKRASTSEESGFLVLTTWGEPAAPDWSLRVRMKTPKTLVRYSYALKDVPLP